MDVTLQYTVCKHIHFIHMSINKQEEEENMENKDELQNANGVYEKKDEPDTIENKHRNESMEYNETDNECESNKSCDIYKGTVDSSEFNTHEYFSHVLQADSFTDLTACKSKVENMMQKLLSLIQSSSDIDALTTVKEHIQSGIAVLESKRIYFKNKKISGLQQMTQVILIILNNLDFS